MKPVIVFDLDDTLYSQKTFAWGGLEAVAHFLKKEHGVDGFEAVAKRFYEEGLRGTIFNEALKQLGQEPEDGLIEKLVSIYRNHDPQITLFPDAKEAINRWRKKHRLALITDGDFAVQQKKVDALGLSEVFEVAVLTGEYGQAYEKPSAFPYEKVMEGLGVSGDQCVYLGDNPNKDFLTAKKLGWHTIRVRREGLEFSGLKLDADHEADQEVEDLAALIEN